MKNFISVFPVHWPSGQSVRHVSGDLGSIPGRFTPKNLKMVLDTPLLNAQQYKVRIKGKVEQSRKGVAPLPNNLVAIFVFVLTIFHFNVWLTILNVCVNLNEWKLFFILITKSFLKGSLHLKTHQFNLFFFNEIRYFWLSFLLPNITCSLWNWKYSNKG